MKLRFLGTGGAFSDTHTNAWFYLPADDKRAEPLFTVNDSELSEAASADNVGILPEKQAGSAPSPQAVSADTAGAAPDRDLYFLDLSMLNIFKARALVTEKVRDIYVLLTHMHDDHCSGIGLFSEWLYYKEDRCLNIIADETLHADIREYMRIIGVLPAMFRLDSKNEVVKKIIPTKHTESLEGKCFGYLLEIQGTSVVYTGDTAALDSFLPYLEPGTELYTEMSCHGGKVHLLWSEQKELLLELCRTCDICFMHMDDPGSLQKEIAGSRIVIASANKAGC